MKPTLTYFLGTIRNIIVTVTFLGLLSRGTAYLIYLSLGGIFCGEAILTFTLDVCYKFIVRHDKFVIYFAYFFILLSRGYVKRRNDNGFGTQK